MYCFVHIGFLSEIFLKFSYCLISLGKYFFWKEKKKNYKNSKICFYFGCIFLDFNWAIMGNFNQLSWLTLNTRKQQQEKNIVCIALLLISSF